MVRVLAALTGAALLVLLLEVAGSSRALPALSLAVVYAVGAVAGFRVVSGRRRAFRGAYVGGELVLGFAVFQVGGPGVGATLLLLVLVIEAVLLLPLPWAVAVAAVVPLVHVGMPWPENLQQGASTSVAVGFAVVLAALHLQEQRARTALDAANAELRRHASQVQALAASEERNRVARDIHDGLGHHLSVVQMQVQAARAVLRADPGHADDLLDKAGHQAREALAEVRRSVAALRGASATPVSQAIATLASETQDAGLATSVVVRGSARRLPDATELVLYRAAQEGLTNTRRHAHAASATVLLDYSDPQVVRLRLEDDGAGLPTATTSVEGGFGLLGVRERVEGLGGRVDVTSAPGHGVVLSLEVPG